MERGRWAELADRQAAAKKQVLVVLTSRAGPREVEWESEEEMIHLFEEYGMLQEELEELSEPPLEHALSVAEDAIASWAEETGQSEEVCRGKLLGRIEDQAERLRRRLED